MIPGIRENMEKMLYFKYQQIQYHTVLIFNYFSAVAGIVDSPVRSSIILCQLAV